jgi:hypothetical protein
MSMGHFREKAGIQEGFAEQRAIKRKLPHGRGNGFAGSLAKNPEGELESRL